MKFFYNAEVHYNGENYFGWQKQKNFKTIQDTIEDALRVIAPSEKIRTMGSSRTDTGVHSRANVCFIQIQEDLEPHELTKKLNQELPNDIRITKCERTYRHFKVVYFAKRKQYLYIFKINNSDHSPFYHSIEENLDIEKMKVAAKVFIGTHDFRNFCHKVSENVDKKREIFECKIIEDQDFISENNCHGSYALVIEGSGFLKQMVRIIMGSLINIGLGKTTLSQIQEALVSTEFKKTGFIAPGGGLYLNEIEFIRDPFKGPKSKKKKS
ncbi:tRNA pseudouridine(38-40) synthase TruA [Halobacteriovorax marinus]|uniref:tRNA pseudouridine(38-40) synthase TruA n=1 Tax=Halobacteriovorax marinus TaxID=97084 RepID=UPI000BC35F8F|nr:tRNA pseudouridine(38-40) synthase TruA [Halobacteriovorax marinus]ATH08435.1 tRNA pseudouridine(38-40) synthase TruA [Halobacteriovorax marinus]